jgi:hypothetical protein
MSRVMRFQVRVSYALELVLVLAAGMACARWAVLSHPDWPAYFAKADLGRRFQFVAEPFLVGVSLAGGLGLLVESLRRRSPATWGLGRRIWSVAALTSLFSAAGLCATQMGVIWRTRPAHLTAKAAVAWVRYSSFTTFYPSAGWVLAAVLVTSWFSGEPRCGHLDAREWSGRILLGMIVMEAITFRFLGIIS